MSEDGGWVMIALDEKVARRQGVPKQIPVPKAEFDGMAEKGLQLDMVRKWITSFLTIAPSSWRTQNAPLATRYDAFIAKVDAWNKAQDAFGKNDYDKAISSLKMICNIDKEDHAARLNLAAALANKGEHQKALESFKMIRETFEGEPDYHVMVGQVHLALGDQNAVIDEMASALQAKPDCQPALDVLKQLGVLVAIYEDPRDATSLTYVRADSLASYLPTVWDAAPRDGRYYVDQVGYHGNEQRHGIALAAAERGLALPDLEPALRDRLTAAKVTALRSLGRLDEAMGAARAWTEAAPSSSYAHAELARCLRDAGKKEDAGAELDKALGCDPGDLVALDLKFGAENPQDLEQVQATIPGLAAFAAAHPTVPGAQRALARAKLRVAADEEGLALLEKAVSMAPADDDLRAEWWGELGRLRRFDQVLSDAGKLADMGKRDWKLRWNEAEAFAATGKMIEARAAFTAINADEALHVDIRKRAKRAVLSLGNPAP